MRGLLFGWALAAALASPVFADEPASPAPQSDDGSFYGDLQQVALTEADVKNYIDAMADMQAAMGDAPADAAEPDAKTMAKLEAVAKAHGFSSFNAYNTVAGNIALVLDGVDPETKTYVGADKIIDKAVAQVEADSSLSDKDRKSELSDLQMQRKTVLPVKHRGNIDLVVKNYDALNKNE